jgi:hypothetical protein
MKKSGGFHSLKRPETILFLNKLISEIWEKITGEALSLLLPF